MFLDWITRCVSSKQESLRILLNLQKSHFVSLDLSLCLQVIWKCESVHG